MKPVVGGNFESRVFGISRETENRLQRAISSIRNSGVSLSRTASRTTSYEEAFQPETAREHKVSEQKALTAASAINKRTIEKCDAI